MLLLLLHNRIAQEIHCRASLFHINSNAETVCVRERELTAKP
jgi:hypothetical protein